jgi:hypothetical protein
MGWLTIISLIIKAITEGPELIAAIQKWLDLIRKTPKAQQPRERVLFEKALRSELEQRAQVAAGVCSADPDRPCQVSHLVKELEAKVGAL